jgi:putative oxidoreductase
METNSAMMKKMIFQTRSDIGPAILRVVLGFVIAAHGAQKLLGWFDGYGFTATMTYFTETMHFPWLLGFLIILLESIGAIALVAGLGTRILALTFTCLAAGISIIHIKNGFFMNWFGNNGGEGYEYFLLWIAIAVTLTLTGGGKYSVDEVIYDDHE